MATAEALGNVSGRYFEDCDAITIEGRGHMQNEAMAERLMQVSEELTKDYLVDQRLPDRSEFKNGMRGSEGDA